MFVGIINFLRAQYFRKRFSKDMQQLDVDCLLRKKTISRVVAQPAGGQDTAEL